MTNRTPHAASDTEVRQAIQRLGVDSDEHATDIAAANTAIAAVQVAATALKARVDTLEGGDDSRLSSEAAESIGAGFPVYGLSGLASVGVARADLAVKGRVLGVARAAAAAGASVAFAAGGRVKLTDWTAVAGTQTLTPSAVYYLAESGGITTVAPSEAGMIVTEIGQATGADTLTLNITRPIKL